MPTMPASPVATGRGMRIRLPCAGDRRLEGRARWPEIREARCDRCRRSASNGAECGDRRKAHGRPPAGCSLQRCPKSPPRGCRKATQGTPPGFPVGSQVSPRAGPAGPAGAGGKPAPGLPRGARVPVAPRSHPLAAGEKRRVGNGEPGMGLGAMYNSRSPALLSPPTGEEQPQMPRPEYAAAPHPDPLPAPIARSERSAMRGEREVA